MRGFWQKSLCRHCEISSWHLKVRCKEHLALLNSTNDGAKIDSDDPIVRMKQFGDDYFQASINNLRMITNYSVSVKAYRGEANRSIREQFSTNHISATDYKQGVMVETKSCKCQYLPNNMLHPLHFRQKKQLRQKPWDVWRIVPIFKFKLVLSLEERSRWKDPTIHCARSMGIVTVHWASTISPSITTFAIVK